MTIESDALHRMLHPRSIAMVGASESLLKTGGRRMRSLLAAPFAGQVYPINPGRDQVQGATAYPDLRSVPAPLDLAVVAVPVSALEQVVDDGLRAGVAGFICITAGLGEVDEAGKAAQAALGRRIRAAGARLVGPNCNGVFFASAGLNCTPVPAIKPGHVAVISQSGNIGTAFMHMSRRARVGLSAVMTIGNAEDVSAAELLAELDRDPMTHAVCLYLEGLGKGGGEALLEAGLRMRRRKPVIAVKAGSTPAGQRAVTSHTGSLATDDSATTALFEAAGIMRVEGVDEAFDVAMSVCGGLLPAGADGVVVLSDSGGPAALCADVLSRLGVALPELLPSTENAVAELLPAFASFGNPIDFAGVAESNPMTLASVAEICLRDPRIGVILLVGHFGGYGLATGGAAAGDELNTGRRLAELAREAGKRIVIQSIYARDDLPMLVGLTEKGIPCYETIRAACTAVWGLVAASTGRRPRSGSARVAPAAGAFGVQTATVLSEPDGRRLLSALGLSIPPWRVASTGDQAVDAFTELGADGLVAKIVSSVVTHKSDVRGVVLDIRSAAQARAAFEMLTSLRMPGGGQCEEVMLTPMLGGHVELTAGYLNDYSLGPLVVIGFGGTQVELKRDVAIRPARVVRDGDRAEIMTMLRELQGWPLLAGYRGRPAMDFRTVVDVVRILARLPELAPEILEVDLNPVIVGPTTGDVADVRVLVEVG